MHCIFQAYLCPYGQFVQKDVTDKIQRTLDDIKDKDLVPTLDFAAAMHLKGSRNASGSVDKRNFKASKTRIVTKPVGKRHPVKQKLQKCK